MMTDTQVFGKRAGQFAAYRAKGLKNAAMPMPVECAGTQPRYTSIRTNSHSNESLIEIVGSIRKKMQKHVTILRSEENLLHCLSYLEDAERHVADMKCKGDFSLVDCIRIRNLIAVGKLVTESALARRESRGGHFREDFSNLQSIFAER
jgi:succinate dehydrogenase/fumarate reductase flavoprotein subunit